MKEYIIPPDPNILKEYTAIIQDENSSVPKMYIGTGKTAEEALRVAKEKSEKGIK